MNDATTVERQVQVVNPQGFHARPAAEFVKLASRFASDVWIAKDGLEVNGKSIMGVLMLAAEQGSTLTIRADGEDATEAVDQLCALVASGFQEEA
ncbi:MAG: HPr family phosphocarrier protein [Gemmatimonadetes bacterium]|nr:MAG: HPr family phosphocarrier protein [Gemmatimonadota bacterium]